MSWSDLPEDWEAGDQMSAASFNAYAARINAHSAALSGVLNVYPIRFSAAIAVLGVTGTDRAYGPRNLVGARMRVASAPVGSDLVAEVHHWDGFTWNTLGELTIPDGSVVEAVVEFDSSTEQDTGNLVRINLTSIGAASAATGVSVDVVVG